LNKEIKNVIKKCFITPNICPGTYDKPKGQVFFDGPDVGEKVVLPKQPKTYCNQHLHIYVRSVKNNENFWIPNNCILEKN
jgi:hypothetical protein